MTQMVNKVVISAPSVYDSRLIDVKDTPKDTANFKEGPFSDSPKRRLPGALVDFGVRHLVLVSRSGYHDRTVIGCTLHPDRPCQVFSLYFRPSEAQTLCFVFLEQLTHSRFDLSTT